MIFLRLSHCMSVSRISWTVLTGLYSDSDIAQVELPLPWAILTNLQVLGLVCVSSQ